jgi:hypothetical protein
VTQFEGHKTIPRSNAHRSCPVQSLQFKAEVVKLDSNSARAMTGHSSNTLAPDQISSEVW